MDDIKAGDEVLIYKRDEPYTLKYIKPVAGDAVAVACESKSGIVFAGTLPKACIKKYAPPPKFKVGDLITSKITGDQYLITEVSGESYTTKRMPSEDYIFSRGLTDKNFTIAD